MTRVHAIKDRGSIHLHGANLTYSGKGEETHQIRDGDPLSHQIEMAYTITLEREDPKWQIRTVTHTLVTATESDFLVTASLMHMKVTIKFLVNLGTLKSLGILTKLL